MAFSVNMKDALPLIRAAFDAKELQMFTAKPGSKCLYEGPCAVGILLDEDTRKDFDAVRGVQGTSVETLYRTRRIKFPARELADWTRLQQAHDSVVINTGLDGVATFSHVLYQLEEKYK
jgi:hypothetical protein